MQSVESKAQPQRLPHPVRITEQVWPEGTVPVVSIWCITYNHVNFIRDAIEGFLMQETTFPVEIFIHDDASTDGTAEVIKEYAGKYPQLFWTVFQTENQWSKGNKKILFDYLAQQRGEFIALCEGDDYWTSPQKLQKQVELLEGSPGMLFCGTRCFDVQDPNEYPYQIPPFGSLETLSSLTPGDMVLGKWWLRVCTRMAPKKVWQDYAQWSAIRQPPTGDVSFIMFCAAKARNASGAFGIVDEPMAVYREHRGGVFTGAATLERAKTHLKNVMLAKPLLVEAGMSRYILPMEYADRFALATIVANDPVDRLKQCAWALLRTPFVLLLWRSVFASLRDMLRGATQRKAA